MFSGLMMFEKLLRNRRQMVAVDEILAWRFN